ncbi:protoporphyrinogen oxidase [Fusarium circinatum]|uniref:Protoporphyrinogen oxidase n=1 Tax=Fusarium circinatum TaxID=48490 RepID=A0A8H5TRB6_FUSCI|nr:protoporphyrinogen oxidase [Fusarium circinatum]
MPNTTGTPATWVVVGASRGIGLEYVKQLLQAGNRVIATARNPKASELSEVIQAHGTPDNCILEQCDVASSESIDAFAARMSTLKLVNLNPDSPPSKLIFISSDSGSTTNFLAYEDGFAAYAASKAALNQMLRHMAEELKRRAGKWAEICVLALHPGEVHTDMNSGEVGTWDVGTLLEPGESVSGMLKVINEKNHTETGTFWCWDGRASLSMVMNVSQIGCLVSNACLTRLR